MNPVCLVAQGNMISKEARKEKKSMMKLQKQYKNYLIITLAEFYGTMCHSFMISIRILPKWLLCLEEEEKPGSCVNLAMGQHGAELNRDLANQNSSSFTGKTKCPFWSPPLKFLVDPLWQIKHFLGQEWETKRPLSTNNYKKEENTWEISHHSWSLFPLHTVRKFRN